MRPIHNRQSQSQITQSHKSAIINQQSEIGSSRLLIADCGRRILMNDGLDCDCRLLIDAPNPQSQSQSQITQSHKSAVINQQSEIVSSRLLIADCGRRILMNDGLDCDCRLLIDAANPQSQSQSQITQSHKSAVINQQSEIRI